MVARLKLKGIDGRRPPGVEPAALLDTTRENSQGPDIVRIDRLIATPSKEGSRRANDPILTQGARDKKQQHRPSMSCIWNEYF